MTDKMKSNRPHTSILQGSKRDSSFTPHYESPYKIVKKLKKYVVP